MKVYLKVMSHIFSISQYITYNAFHTISWLSTQTALLTACYWLLCIHYCSAEEWNPDVRSNESRFLLLRTDSRVCVWKRPCAAMDRACQQDAIQTGGRSLIVRNIFFFVLKDSSQMWHADLVANHLPLLCLPRSRREYFL